MIRPCDRLRFGLGRPGETQSGQARTGPTQSCSRNGPGNWAAARLVLAALLLLGLAPAAWAFTERPVTLGPASATLHGVLTLPDGEARVPGVLIIAGSGPVDHDGNLPGMPNNGHLLLAHALADRGIASIRVDKRGVGASAAAAPPMVEMRFNDYVEDAVAWLAVLRAEPRVASVAILGHSEGALVATLVAQRGAVSRLVSLAGAGEPAGPVIEAQIASQGAPPEVLAFVHRVIDALLAGTEVPAIPPAFMGLFRPDVQPYIASWLRLNPATELAAVTVPVLIVNGTTDVQVPAEQAQILHRALPSAQLVLIEGMNHILRIAPAARHLNVATYAMPFLPLAPGLVEAIAGFLAPP